MFLGYAHFQDRLAACCLRVILPGTNDMPPLELGIGRL